MKYALALNFKIGYKLIDLSDITMLQAEGNYTKIYLKSGRSHIQTKLLKHYENALSSHPNFTRIHAKYIVNLDHCEGFDKVSGSMVIQNRLIPIARRRRKIAVDSYMNYRSMVTIP